MSTVKATNFQNASSATANMVTDASGNVSFGGDATITGSLVPSSSFLRNRIINGDMRVYQRNAVATINGQYSVDRWRYAINSTGTAQTTQSQVSPAGFTESILFDVVTADTSIGASELAALFQCIEGYNISDLYWGAVGAKSVTLSFWVYSTTTGTFCVSFRNGSYTLSYIAEYTINAINTWEYKTITVPGPTTGTWDTTNGEGLSVIFTFAIGTTYQTTANAWTIGNFLGTSSQVNLLASATNSIRLTGVQLEEGTVATPFERQLYSNQLAQCQRYYYRIGPVASQAVFGPAVADTTTAGRCTGSFPVTMRTSPSALEQTGTAGNYVIRTGGTSRTCSAVPSFDSATENTWQINTTVASGQTAGQGGFLRADAIITAYLGWSAEL